MKGFFRNSIIPVTAILIIIIVGLVSVYQLDTSATASYDCPNNDSPAFSRQLEDKLAQMDQPSDNELVVNTTESVDPQDLAFIFISEGASACAGSLCVASGCAGSACTASGCAASACIGSGCVASGCAGSACVGSGCGGSVCVGSGCIGSGCGGSICVGSGCTTSVCVGSACVASGCAGSACIPCTKRNNPLTPGRIVGFNANHKTNGVEVSWIISSSNTDKYRLYRVNPMENTIVSEGRINQNRMMDLVDKGGTPDSSYRLEVFGNKELLVGQASTDGTLSTSPASCPIN